MDWEDKGAAQIVAGDQFENEEELKWAIRYSAVSIGRIEEIMTESDERENRFIVRKRVLDSGANKPWPISPWKTLEIGYWTLTGYDRRTSAQFDDETPTKFDYGRFYAVCKWCKYGFGSAAYDNLWQEPGWTTRVVLDEVRGKTKGTGCASTSRRNMTNQSFVT